MNRRGFISSLMGALGCLCGFRKIPEKLPGEVALSNKKIAVLIKVPNELIKYSRSASDLLDCRKVYEMQKGLGIVDEYDRYTQPKSSDVIDDYEEAVCSCDFCKDMMQKGLRRTGYDPHNFGPFCSLDNY